MVVECVGFCETVMRLETRDSVKLMCRIHVINYFAKFQFPALSLHRSDYYMSQPCLVWWFGEVGAKEG